MRAIVFFCFLVPILAIGQVGVGLEFYTLGAKLKFTGLDTTMISSGSMLQGGIPSHTELAITNPTGTPMTISWSMEFPAIFTGSNLSTSAGVSVVPTWPSGNDPGHTTISWSVTVPAFQSEMAWIKATWGTLDTLGSRSFTVMPVTGGQSFNVDYRHYVEEPVEYQLTASQPGASFVEFQNGSPAWDSLDVVKNDQGQFSVVRKRVSNGIVFHNQLPTALIPGTTWQRIVPENPLATSIPSSRVDDGWLTVWYTANEIGMRSIEDSEIGVYDLQGREILKTILHARENNMIDLPAGLFIIRRTDEQSAPVKVIRW